MSSNSSTTPQRPRPRHLLDPDNLPPRPPRGAEAGMSLTQVQQWVASVLAFTTIEHLAAGVAVAAVFTDADRLDARIGLNVMAGIIGMLAVAAARVIHKRSLVSVWVLAGILPGLVGAWFTFR